MDKTAYGNYLQSPQWRVTRNRALRSARYQCHTCGSKRGLEVHHKTYDRLGSELDDDLEVLCSTCHKDEHAQEMHDSDTSRVYLALASQMLRNNPWASVPDLIADVKDECARLKLPYRHHQVDKAINVLIGANRFSQPVPQTVQELQEAQGRPLTHAESVETLRRLGLDALIKTVSPSVGSIDIDGDLPAPDYSYEVFWE